MVGIMFFQFLVAVYGGYFGAGIGILMLAAFGVIGLTNDANASRDAQRRRGCEVRNEVTSAILDRCRCDRLDRQTKPFVLAIVLARLCRAIAVY